MVTASPSYLKFNYSLRASKQVERKLVIEAMHRLEEVGHHLRECTYLGLGSIYYSDFILFHKYLYIGNMICAEIDPIPKRMKFNKPYDFIDLQMKSVSDVIVTLDRDQPYLVWLDYDSPLSTDILDDLRALLTVLSKGSVFLVTVDAEKRLSDDPDLMDLDQKELEAIRVKQFDHDFGKYYGETVTPAMLSPKQLPQSLSRVLRNFIISTLLPRASVEFLQLFNFQYADNAQMLSLGGILETRREATALRGSRLFELDFVSEQEEPITISVPPLTPQEKYWLDANIHRKLDKRSLKFELPQEMIDSFRQYSRHYPSYYESVI